MIQSSFFNKKLKQMWYIGFPLNTTFKIYNYIDNCKNN